MMSSERFIKKLFSRGFFKKSFKKSAFVAIHFQENYLLIIFILA